MLEVGSLPTDMANIQDSQVLKVTQGTFVFNLMLSSLLLQMMSPPQIGRRGGQTNYKYTSLNWKGLYQARCDETAGQI